jgi:hypothetical protein
MRSAGAISARTKVTRYQIGVATVPRGAEFGRALARHFRAHSFIPSRVRSNTADILLRPRLPCKSAAGVL